MLESRSPASSLMDLAALGLMAGDPSGLPAPPPPATFVGLRPDFGTPDGFDRPLTWAVPVDEGKMADTESPTSFPSQSADRRGGLLEIEDNAPERQPTFTLPQAASEPPAPADDATPVSQVRAAGAPAEPAAEVVAPPLPAFLTLPAPRLPAKEDAPRSDPAVVPQPSASIFSGPMPTGFVTDIQVQEVDFVTDKIVEADPGEVRYPSQDGKPEWRDADLNGYIVDQGTWNPSTEKLDPVEWSVPVAYRRNTSPVVSAKFKVTDLGVAPQGASKELTVRGIWRGYGVSMMCPEVTIPADAAVGEYVYYPPTATYSPLPNYVDSVESANIDWQFRIQGDMAWYSAGMSNTEMFVTLGQPADGPVYHTVVMLSTRAAAGLYVDTKEKEIAATWVKFQTLDLNAADPAFQPNEAQRKAGKKLHYWLNWSPLPGATADELLSNGDGRCGAWSRLMVRALAVHQIAASSVNVTPINNNKTEGLVIVSWEFGGANSKDADYKFGNVRYADGHVTSKAGGFWHYDWDPTAIDVTHLTGKGGNPKGRGQGNTTPRAMFTDHALVRIGTENKLYDPSYGTGPFDGASRDAALLAWEDASVWGFTRVPDSKSLRMPGRSEDFFRFDKVGVLETKQK